MAAFNLLEEFRRPKPPEPSPYGIDEPKAANMAEDRPTPPVMRIWARGESCDLVEAQRRAQAAHDIDSWDLAMAGAALADLVGAGWLIVTRDSESPSLTYTRPESDPVVPEKKSGELLEANWESFEREIPRMVQVATVTGEVVTVAAAPYVIPPYNGPRSGYDEHVRQAIANR